LGCLPLAIKLGALAFLVLVIAGVIGVW
jgi:hypothetical protein